MASNGVDTTMMVDVWV